MITEELINPKSIVVVGGSADITKPGGKVLKNLIDGKFSGSLYVTNLKESEVQGIKSYADITSLPEVDLAIIAIAARFVPDTINILSKQKNTKAFIVLSAGFSEESEEGALLEKEIVKMVNDVGGSLIGPNCIGVLTPNHHSIFTYPIPKLQANGCDFISGSGATACFIMESGIPKGLTFANVFSVGNSAQMGVEEILQYMDETYDENNSSKIKLLYLEAINKPQMLLKHARSLIKKGCSIAAVKAGSSDAGTRAASSHTGALASSDSAVDALFRKAGIIRCYGREDLISVASVLMHPKPKGKNFAIITHAGGPAVMLTDTLTNNGINVPHIDTPESRELLNHLFPGSSVSNPIDFLATGTAEQLGIIIDFVEERFEDIDAMVVIFGTPGLFPVFNVYDVLDLKMSKCKKPIYPVLPSTLTAKEEVEIFISKGRINFPDEVVMGNALAKVLNIPAPAEESLILPGVDKAKIRAITDKSDNGYLAPEIVQQLLDAAGIPRAAEAVAHSADEASNAANDMGFPVVMKVVGPIHKSDAGGVVLNVMDENQVRTQFEKMMKIPETTAILLQPMLSGTELFAGAKYEENFGHMILCGLGGIFIEVLRDVAQNLAPVYHDEAISMIRSLKSYKIIEGIRGSKGVDEEKFAEILVKLSALLEAAPEITELDLNPLLGSSERVIAVDARIRIEK
ncbi:MAG: acetate--CoA ligase family protein [Bacteroidota bacterium]